MVMIVILACSMTFGWKMYTALLVSGKLPSTILSKAFDTLKEGQSLKGIIEGYDTVLNTIKCSISEALRISFEVACTE